MQDLAGLKREGKGEVVLVVVGQVRVSHCLANWVRTENRTAFWFGARPEIMLQELGVESLIIGVA